MNLKLNITYTTLIDAYGNKTFTTDDAAAKFVADNADQGWEVNSIGLTWEEAHDFINA